MIVTTNDKHYGDIADAIRDKLGTTDGYKPEDMAAAVGDIESGGGNYQSKSVTYTSSGTDTVTPDAGYDALSEVNVTVDVGVGSAPTIADAFFGYGDITFNQPSNMFGTCNLTDIQFSDCRIDNACFSNISLENCSFINSFLQNVSFEGATIDGETGTSADNIVLYNYMDTCFGFNITLPSGATYSS